MELLDASRYYESRQVGLGSAFLDDIELVLTSITEQPDAGRVLKGIVRRQLCHRFPYAVVYSVPNEEIRVLAIMNLRRRPNYWVERS